MRIIHTSDWHIGKRLCGRDRLNEQRDVLFEIADICEKERTDLVLVAGDVFDNFLPSAEAEDLFYEAIKKIAGEDRLVLIISGNHDDNVRLAAASAIAERQGIYIFGNTAHSPQPGRERRVRISEAGISYAVVSDGEEEIFINILPYPNEARLREDKIPDESFTDKMRRWIAAGQSKNVRGLPSVFLSHLFVAGGKVSDGEREIDLGGARAVPLELLLECAYAALGHLHRRQHFRNNVYYSGSILQYSFDEAGAAKSVVAFDMCGGKAQNIREIPLTKGRQLVCLEADGPVRAKELLAMHPQALIELTLRLHEPLLASQVRELKESSEGLVSIVSDVRTAEQERRSVSRKTMSSSELFKEYYKSIYAEYPADDLTELFLSLTEDLNETSSS